MHARWFRHLFNIYPPYLGAGVHVTRLAPDWRSATVRMPLRWYNRNYVGTQFGGSLYSMTDPFLMIMLMKNLGDDYLVIDKSGEVEYVSPGRGRVTAEFRLTDDDLQRIRQETTDKRKYLAWFDIDIRADNGDLVARVRKQIYIRRKNRPTPDA
jgi:acyl-coenzyme A thioesterase PaaI-like protein